jgi:hypothetical protein
MVFSNPTELGYAAVGGALLAIATTINYVFRGRITGMSGYFWSIVSLNRSILFLK